MRLAFAMAEEGHKHRVTALAVTLGFLRSEAMLEHFGATEANWEEGAKKHPDVIASKTPDFAGRAVAAPHAFKPRSASQAIILADDGRRAPARRRCVGPRLPSGRRTYRPARSAYPAQAGKR